MTSGSTLVLPAAPPLAVASGLLMTIAQLVMWPFDTDAHVATSQSVTFQVAGAAYYVAFVLLLLALIACYGWEIREAGRFGGVAATVALVGTMALSGDLWFETFAVPWLADEAPGSLDTSPTTLLGIGAVASYLLFAVGWLLFGLASYRAGVFPRPIAAALAVGGVVGFNALLAPFGIPLGLSVAALGLWMYLTRSRKASGDRAGRAVPVG